MPSVGLSIGQQQQEPLGAGGPRSAEASLKGQVAEKMASSTQNTHTNQTVRMKDGPVQPKWMSGRHDHLQYHFFSDEMVVNVRAFGSESGQSVWCWVARKTNDWKVELVIFQIQFVSFSFSQGRSSF